MELTRDAFLQEGQRRMELLDKLMEDKGLDAVLFTSTAQQAYMLAVKYCSGYAIPTRRDFFFKERGKLPYLLVHTAGHEFHAKRESFIPADHVIGGDCANKAIAMVSAMGKAANITKEAADYVTDDIDEDGLYNALKHFELI